MAVGLYIHVPFCKRKCPYCDFYSQELSDGLESDYIHAVIRNLIRYKGETLDSIYFGGGTPSLLSDKSFEEIFFAIKDNFTLINPEISLEANPCSVTFEKLKFLREVGFNRISFGVQSCVDSELEALGRIHTFSQAENSVRNAQKAGFSNISCDLMLGIIGQTKESLDFSISKLTDLSITHVSAYILKIEQGTRYNRKEIIESLPDEDFVSKGYLQAVEALSKKGFEQYEISNFSKAGYECRHNLKYWLCEEYIGIGPSAHSFFNGKRYAVPPDIKNFNENAHQREIVNEESPRTFEEVAMLRLRLTDGLEFSVCEEFGVDKEVIIKKAEPLKKAGFVNIYEDRIAITREGFLVSNEIIARLI